MTYTIKITNDETMQAKSLLVFLESLAQTKEYSFLKIELEKDILDTELMEALNYRFEHFLKNVNDYKDWDDIKEKYIKK